MQPSPYNKVNAYQKNQKIQAEVQPANSRETDARALLVCASNLSSAKQLLENGNPTAKANLKIYGDAIRRNQELWTIFQVALTDPENPLPPSLKTTLFSISRYVDKASFGAIGKFEPDLVDSLIRINRTIAEGLSKRPVEDAPVPVVNTTDQPMSLMTSA